jgi:DNA-binding response OmpR family regulator
VAVNVGMLRIDERRSRASLRGEPLGLRPLDLRVLALLARARGRAISRRRLAEDLWGAGAEVDVRTIDTAVVRIRRALDGRADAIVTVRRIGYRLDPDRFSG